MSTIEIQNLIGKAQVNKGHTPVCSNLSYFLNFESDVITVSKAGYIYEFEVKISKADFRKDADKIKKHNLYSMGSEAMPNYMFYVCPEGLVKGHEIPGYSGLIYVNIQTLLPYEVKPAPLLHKHKHDLFPLMAKICRVQAERLYLGGCKLTIKNKEIAANNKRLLEEAGFNK